MAGSNIPKVSDIEINRWYVCLIGQVEELCKVTRCFVTDCNGVMLGQYKVVCYYTGKDLFVGELSECRKYLREKLLIRR